MNWGSFHYEWNAVPLRHTSCLKKNINMYINTKHTLNQPSHTNHTYQLTHTTYQPFQQSHHQNTFLWWNISHKYKYSFQIKQYTLLIFFIHIPKLTLYNTKTLVPVINTKSIWYWSKQYSILLVHVSIWSIIIYFISYQMLLYVILGYFSVMININNILHYK